MCPPPQSAAFKGEGEPQLQAGKGRPQEQQWQLYGAAYDFEPFVQSHPGGQIAIRLAQGMDGTKLFESYHTIGRGRAWDMLEKFRVGAAKPRAPDPSPFRDDIEKMLAGHFGVKGPLGRGKATTRHALLVSTFAAIELIGLVAWVYGYTLGLLVWPIFHWLAASNISHDSSHFAFSRSARLNSVLTYTSLPFVYGPVTWYQQHVVMHHTGANELDNDPDLQHFQPMKLHTADTRSHPETHTLLDYVKIIGSALHLSWTIPLVAGGVGTSSFRKWYGQQYTPSVPLPTGLAAFQSYRVLNFIAPLMFIGFIGYPFFVFSGWGTKFAFGVLPPAVCSVIFTVITQVSHVQPEAQAASIRLETDFFKKQALTAVDYSTDSPLWSVLTGGLNMQSLHHVLPGVSSCHYVALYPKFEQICAKHGVKLAKRRGLWHAACTAFQHVRMLNTSARVRLLNEMMHAE